MNGFRKIIATFFYLGMIKYAPGTFGTLGAALCYAALWYFGLAHFFVILGCFLAASFANIAVGDWAEKHFGKKDPGCVVIDEVAGYFLTVLFFAPSFITWIGGFLFFRLFDIAKPYPVKKCEKLPGGYGILLDDLAAAIYAAICLGILETLLQI
ncbi:MAG: phosphatidylglycerophosphatase A [Candidatus Brocadiae bacterium]|nr:phosphatidylglycerophosphatase A [Candidatus Brocadiia bacterium]